MRDFNPDRPRLLSYERASRQIGNAWLAQFRGDSWLSHAIQYATGGPHSHSAMLAKTASGEIELLEVREWHGGRIRPLEQMAASYPGRIDVFSPNAGGLWSWDWSEPAAKLCFDPKGAVRLMKLLTRQEYGYRSVLRIALRKIPGLWRLYPITTNDVINGDLSRVRPFCSHAVALAYRKGGMVDVVPRMPDWLVSPNDLTHSLFFDYQFTLAP